MLENYKKTLKEKGLVYLRVKVGPGAAKTEIKQIMADETIKINIAAPAQKGRANQELVNFLAREFAAMKSNVKILSGVGERLKLVKIVK